MNSDKRRDLMLIENAFVTTLVFAIFRLKHTHTNTHALHICTHTHRGVCKFSPELGYLYWGSSSLLASLSQMHDSWKVLSILANIHICVPFVCLSLSLCSCLPHSLSSSFIFCFPHWTLRLDRKFSPSCLLTYLLLISFAVCCLFHLPLSLSLALSWCRVARDVTRWARVHPCPCTTRTHSHTVVSCWVICWFRRDF